MSNSVNPKSDRQLAALSGLAIVLVVVGHATAALPDRAVRIAAVSPAYALFLQVVAWIYTFHMPLFMVLSGYHYERYTRRSGAPYLEFVRSKARRLLLPYFAISTVAYPIKAALSDLAMRPAQFSLAAYAKSLLVPWTNPIIFFWFLPTLFLCLLVAPVLARRERFRGEQLVVFAVLVLLWRIFPHTNRYGLAGFVNVGGALHNLVFFYSGILAARHDLPNRARHPEWGAVLLLALSVALFLIVPDLAWPQLPLAFAGIGCSFLSAYSLKGAALKVFAAIGDYSYSIYLLSWFPIVFVRIATRAMPDKDMLGAVLLSIVGGLLVPMLAVRLLGQRAPRPLRAIIGAA
ncbi:MAG TPA: acyltransferase [Steroidobacteraceae bacterium]|nr:acyltransferase [Steroidobacteraceae bacterium]